MIIIQTLIALDVRKAESKSSDFQRQRSQISEQLKKTTGAAVLMWNPEYKEERLSLQDVLFKKDHFSLALGIDCVGLPSHMINSDA